MEASNEIRSETKSAFERVVDLDDLARMDSAALEALYRRGTMPASLHALDGHPRGRMLAVRTLERGAAARGLRRFAASRGFPWGGKSFTAQSATRGRGINRVHLGGRHQLFPFLTLIADSLIDGRPCVQLDYDSRDNPGVIRKIHDEVREVSSGVFLGPAMWKTRQGATLVLWFALDTNHQAEPIGQG